MAGAVTLLTTGAGLVVVGIWTVETFVVWTAGAEGLDTETDTDLAGADLTETDTPPGLAWAVMTDISRSSAMVMFFRFILCCR